jgi:hypothetical protein
MFDMFGYKPDEVRSRENNRKIKLENAKVPKDLPDKLRRNVLEMTAPEEKQQRKLDNRAKNMGLK